MRASGTFIAGVLLLAASTSTAFAQTCSCASVPLLGAMQSASPNDQQWFIASTYEFHELSELVSGSSTIPDQTGRDRTSQAMIFEVSRGLSDKWSISALLALAEHERDIGGDRDSASGLGDAAIMLKYSPTTISLYSKNTLSFGIGSRLPIGTDDAKDDGLTLAEDLQPSTGAYAGMVWAYYARALNESRGAQIYASGSYTYNGDNDRSYQFGNNVTLAFGGSYQTGTPWGFNLELLYRNADRDQRNKNDIPNTGGRWLDIVPAIQYHVTETLALSVSAKIPVTRDLNDTLQFTSKYAARVSLSYVFGS